jgi:NAD(P)-dependent dehydrogenase (short-subunit alcohol dehydrogenase family)
MNMHGQAVVVLGGSSGIGLSTVRQLARHGARVVAVARNAGRLDAAIAGMGDGVAGEAFDCGDRAALDAFFARVGKIDHLVLALSGGEGGGTFATLDMDALRRGFDAKFWPHLEAAQASLPALRQGGSMTFITAISARLALPGTAGLAAINGAIESVVGVLARELQPIRVNAVAPGVIDTPWWDRTPPKAKAELFRQQAETLPAGRVGQADDVADAVCFLAGNAFVTGSVVTCDGGMHLL